LLLSTKENEKTVLIQIQKLYGYFYFHLFTLVLLK